MTYADAAKLTSPSQVLGWTRHHGFNPPINAHARWGKTAYLYFIGHGDLTKIGITVDLEGRLAQLRAGNPEGLSVRAFRRLPRALDRQVERRMHEHFAELAIGREWFRGLDMREALKVAATQIRLAQDACRRWEAEGLWRWLDA